MSSKKTLNAKNLAELGAERLAELLIELSTGNAAAKRRLRLELASAQSPGDVAKEVRKRLIAIGRSRSFVDWQNRRALVDDLETQRRAIVEHVAQADPLEALDLMWRFLALADSVLDRCEDGGRAVIGIFRTANSDLGEIAKAARIDPTTLADQAFEALLENDYGQYDNLIDALTAALGQKGLEHLKHRMIAMSAESVEGPADQGRRFVAFGSDGPIDVDELLARFSVTNIRMALMKIADAQGDVDAFIGQYDEQTRKLPRVAAEIAQRLVAAGRAQEAWRTIEAAEHGPERGGWTCWPDFAWEDARIDVLDALGRGEEAQAARWSCFERTLSAAHLRAYLKRLPDFDDIAAEERALEYAQGHESPLQALSFLVSWPALDRAADLVIQRVAELDGDHYAILTPAADALAGKHPLAATLLLREMIDFALTQSRSSRYRHAARHLMECTSLAASIPDFGTFETHEAYVAKLRREHGRKTSFWSQIR